MPKEAATLPLSLAGPRADRDLYRWLYEELRAAILAGRLRPGSRLPATRDLAQTYRISRPTAVTAFEQLKSEGYVEGRAGSGTYVSQVLPREAVAEYLNTSRGVKCSAEQVLIVSGAQEALDRTARVLLNPDEPVWMEEPGYPGAAVVFHAVGAKICPVPVDDEGVDMERGIRRWRRARLVYVTPAHQFPLGVTMSLRRRLALLEWARRSGTLIFEDDYDSEYRYSGRPIPALQGLDRSGVVIFAGSFSAVLFPALRLGYLVVPTEMVEVFAAAESVSTHHPPLLEQAVLCDFITEGHFARHVRRMREVYAERLSVLLEGARERLSGLLEISNVEAGLQTVGWLKGRVIAERAAKAAAEQDVEVVALSRYASGHARKDGLILGFAAVDPKEIRRGVAALAAVLEGMRGS